MKTSLLASLFFSFVLFSSTSAIAGDAVRCIVGQFRGTLTIIGETIRGINTELKKELDVAVEKARTNLQTELDKIAEDKCALGLLDVACTAQQTFKTLAAVTSVTNTLREDLVGIVGDSESGVQAQLKVILKQITDFQGKALECTGF